MGINGSLYYHYKVYKCVTFREIKKKTRSMVEVELTFDKSVTYYIIL